MKTALLDSSFLIDLADETAARKRGPAHRTLEKLAKFRLYVSAVTVAELMEGADAPEAVALVLSAYHFQTIGWAAARRCALIQTRVTRRLGENDAWQAALAVNGGHVLVGHDQAFSNRPGLDYFDHWAA